MKAKITLLCAAIASVNTGFANAQESKPRPSQLLEEIVVTAQKREQSLQEIAVAVTAYSSDQMKELNIISTQDLSNFTPSMSFVETAGGGEGNKIYMRGIGRETSVLGTEPGVGLYDNGFYTAEAGILSASPERVERIEILRGPQGTLYGRNTTAGAITVVAKRPADEFEGTVRAVVGDYGNQYGELTLTGPINDKVRYYVNYNNWTRDSFYNNVSGPDPIGTDSERLEVQLDIDISEDVNWNLRYFTADFENETVGFQHLGETFNNGPLKLGDLVVNPELFGNLSESPSNNDAFDIDSDFQGKTAIDGNNNYHSILTVDFDNVTLKVLNGYSEQDWSSVKDYDGISGAVSYTEHIEQNNWTMQHEVQLLSSGDGPLQWATGVFYFKEHSSQPYALIDAGNPYLGTAVDFVNGGLKDNPDRNLYRQLGELQTETTAVYGQMDWDATDSLVLTAGLRYSLDKKTGQESKDVYYDTLGCSFNYYPGIGNPFDPDYFYAPIDYSDFVANGNPLADACLVGGDGVTPDLNPRYGAYVAGGEDKHSDEWESVTWRLGANWAVTDSSQLYATLSSGYKAGGFRLGGLDDVAGTSKNEAQVDEEELIAFELGYKANLTDTLSVNMAAYYYQYDDMQLELSLLKVQGVTSELDNAPQVDIQGFELEGNWVATDKLSFLLAYSYNKSEIKEDYVIRDITEFEEPTVFPTNVPVEKNVKGNRLSRSPKNKVALAGYFVQPFEAGSLVVSATYAHIDEQYTTVFNNDIQAIDSYYKVDARVSWKDAAERYEVSVFGQNLTDEVSYANGYGVGTEQTNNRAGGRPTDPRTYGAEVVYFF